MMDSKSREYQSSDILIQHKDNKDNAKGSIKEFTSKRREILLLNISIETEKEKIESLHSDLRKCLLFPQCIW